MARRRPRQMSERDRLVEENEREEKISIDLIYAINGLKLKLGRVEPFLKSHNCVMGNPRRSATHTFVDPRHPDTTSSLLFTASSSECCNTPIQHTFSAQTVSGLSVAKEQEDGLIIYQAVIPRMPTIQTVNFNHLQNTTPQLFLANPSVGSHNIPTHLTSSTQTEPNSAFPPTVGTVKGTENGPLLFPRQGTPGTEKEPADDDIVLGANCHDCDSYNIGDQCEHEQATQSLANFGQFSASPGPSMQQAVKGNLAPVDSGDILLDNGLLLDFLDSIPTPGPFVEEHQ